MIGQTLSHYRILEQLGRGGMGVVYRSRDERLERDVAIKLLPEGALADPEARQRSRREALALSRLNRPAIATVHDFDSQDGIDFLVMEYVEGETLASRIAAGPLALDEVAAFGARIAEALEAAHEQGVVHRDLKPGNIMITRRGAVKVLDFGLASLLQTAERPAGGWVTTQTDVRLGTLPYMAPEQLLGKSTDSRTDLHALGVVLFEMATGTLPFKNPVSTALVYEIINDAPPRPTTLRPDLPAGLEESILRCLGKSPGDRYASARELAEALRPDTAARPPEPVARRRIDSLVVLPLDNLSGDPEQEYFADGMTDALIAELARIGGLRVISRTSAMSYKRARKPLPEIARELRVDAVIAGTVLRAGDRVRINAQLIDAGADRRVWARTYQRDPSDILELQGEVAHAIADEIQLELSPEEQARLGARRAVHLGAYEAYLRGRFLWNQRSVSRVVKSIEYFQQAIAAHPDYALGHVGLADAYGILGANGDLPAGESFPKAKAAAMRALEIDPNLGEAHTSLAFVHLYHDWNWAAAEREFRIALALNPGYATAHQWYAEFLSALGRFDESIVEGRRAHELDPLSWLMHSTLGDMLYYARRYDEAIVQLRHALELGPGFNMLHFDLGRVYLEKGGHREAIEEYELGAKLETANPLVHAGLAYAYAVGGRRDEARRILEALLASHGSPAGQPSAGRPPGSPWGIASVYVGLGDRDRALEWLERALEEQDRSMMHIKVHPRLDPLRGDARMASLLRRMNFPA